MTTTSLRVEGMTCEHCVRAVREEVGALDGVRDVRVDLVAGGASAVVVESDAALDAAALRGAVDEAGYRVVEEDADVRPR